MACTPHALCAGPSLKTLVEPLLDGLLRVGLSDGRVIIGRFACLDKQRNILLTDAREVRFGAAKGEAGEPERSERQLGIVLAPRQHVVSCHAAEVA